MARTHKPGQPPKEPGVVEGPKLTAEERLEESAHTIVEQKAKIDEMTFRITSLEHEKTEAANEHLLYMQCQSERNNWEGVAEKLSEKIKDLKNTMQKVYVEYAAQSWKSSTTEFLRRSL